MGLPLSERGLRFSYVVIIFFELLNLLNCYEDWLNLFGHLLLSVDTMEALAQKTNCQYCAPALNIVGFYVLIPYIWNRVYIGRIVFLSITLLTIENQIFIVWKVLLRYSLSRLTHRLHLIEFQALPPLQCHPRLHFPTR